MSDVLFELDGHVATIILNRPSQLNAVHPQMAAELKKICDDVNDNDEIRAVVLRGAGDRAFCAGSDIKSLDTYATPWDFRNRKNDYCRAVKSIRKPVIVSIHGYCLGGGLETAVMGGDIRYCTKDAKLGAPEINNGWIGGGGNSQYLPRIVGPGRAAEILLTGDFISGAEAERIGLVEKAFDTKEELEAHVYAIANRIAEKAPIAAQVIKHAIRISMNTNLETGLEYENELVHLTFTTEDKAEGERAFKEKRKPIFKGR